MHRPDGWNSLMIQVCQARRLWGTLCLMSGLLLSSLSDAQDKDSEPVVKLPELVAYRLPQDQYLVLSCRVNKPHAEFIKKVRTIPGVSTNSVPTELFIDKYLHRNSH